MKKGVLFSRLETNIMKNIFLPLCLVAGAAAFTGCEKPTECDSGNKAMLTVVNYTACTPNIEVDGDVVATDLGATILEDVPGDSVTVELDEGTYTIKADLPLITLCSEQTTDIETMCGGTYRWEIR